MGSAPVSQDLHSGKACIRQGPDLVGHSQRRIIMIKFPIGKALLRFQPQQFSPKELFLRLLNSEIICQNKIAAVPKGSMEFTV